MRILILAAMAALVVSAQDAKVTPKDVAPTIKAPVGPPTERPWTEVEALKFQLADEKIRRLRESYRIDQFNKEVAPLSGDQTSIAMTLCKSLGIPELLIQSQCSLETGLDQDGKVKLDPTGKPVQPMVRWVKPETIPPAPPVPVPPAAARPAPSPGK